LPDDTVTPAGDAPEGDEAVAAAESEPVVEPAAEPEPAPEPEPAAEPEPAPEPEPAAEPTPQEIRARGIIARLEAELGDAIVGSEVNFGDPVVRVRADAWRRTAEVARDALHCDYLSFVSGIDWLPAPRAEGDEGGDTSAPVQPREMTFGVTGSAGRFQVLACVQSTAEHFNLLVKSDVDEHDPRIESWVPVYAGADWHERECWEMFGIDFTGHPAMRHIYLPFGFEGHPLRKDFPLLAREVKPWPGLVDVEPMPGEEPGDDEE
jgi:NADH-quinone oxidoreductase subunit C